MKRIYLAFSIFIIFFLNSCAEEVEDINLLSYPEGGQINFTIREPNNRLIESVSFSSENLGVYKNKMSESFNLLMENKVDGKVMTQIKLNFDNTYLNRAYVLMLPGKNGDNFEFDSKDQNKSITNVIIGEVSEKVKGSYRFIVPYNDPAKQITYLIVQGTFNCYRIPDTK